MLFRSWPLTELNDITRRVLDMLTDASGEAEDRKKLDIAALYRYVEEHYCQYTFSVQGMAGHFQLSASSLTHFFKKNTGTTILDHVNTKRIHRAARLLTTTSMPVREIVSEIGFSDVSTFIKKFKSYYGVTPGQYKEQNGDAGEKATRD